MKIAVSARSHREVDEFISIRLQASLSEKNKPISSKYLHITLAVY